MYFDLLYEYFKQHKFQFFSVVIGRLILYFIEIIILSMLATRLVYSSENPTSGFMSTAAWFIMVFIMASLLWFIIESYNSYIIPSIQEFVRDQILNSVFFSDKAQQNPDVGSTIANLSKIPQLVYIQMISLSFYVMPFIFTFLFLSIYFFRFGLTIAATFLGVIIILFVIYGVWFQQVVQLSKKRYAAELELSEKFDDVLMNSESIINGNDVQPTLDDLTQEQDIYSNYLQQELMAINTWKQSLDCLIMALNGLVIWIGYKLYRAKKLSLMLFTSLITLIIFVINRLISLINRIGDLPYIMGGIAISEDLVKQQKQNTLGSRGKIFENFDIRVHNLNYGYDSKKILKGISMNIPYKTNHLIYGESGSGKTTLCRCLMGYFPIDESSTITIGDVPINEVDRFYLREHFTFMTQNGFLFDWTARDNISKDPDIMKQLEKMPIYAKIRPLLDRRVGKLGSQLSGGERQIVLLLRTYFRPCFLVILDEPTSNMDTKSRNIIIEIIREMCQTKTVLCITHDPQLVHVFDHVYDLIDGTLTKRITPSSV